MKFNSEEEMRLAVAKTMCLRSTLFYARYFFKAQYNRKFIVGDHHKQICDLIDRIFRGECVRAIINIAPRYGKTELAVKTLISKGLAINAKAKFIHLSYSQTLALDNSETIKDIVKMPEYQSMFPGVEIKKGTDSKEKWYTTAGGGVYAAAAGGQVTGFGAGIVDEAETDSQKKTEELSNWLDEIDTFGGCIVIDDPIKPEDAQSETFRTKVNERFDSTIVNRVNSRKTPIIIIMQRTHPEDLSGHVMANYPGFEVLSLPAIKEDGSALWPHKHSLEELQQMRKTNEFVFDTQYMQDPRPKHGLLFPKSELRRFKPDPLRKFETISAWIDVADEGDDFTSMPVAQTIGPDIYITDVIFNELDTDVTLPMCADLINRKDIRYCTVEANAMGAPFKRALQRACPKCAVYGLTATTNKHTRILMAAGFIKMRCVFLADEHQSDEYRKWFKNLTDYTKNGEVKHDDAADSLSGLVGFIERYFPHVFRTEPKKE